MCKLILIDREVSFQDIDLGIFRHYAISIFLEKAQKQAPVEFLKKILTKYDHFTFRYIFHW